MGHLEREITHLLFANDTILFVGASVNNIHNVLNIIELFCQGSGQRVNVSKSCVVAPKGLSRGTKNALFRTNNF